jgi:hypothetical protein
LGLKFWLWPLETIIHRFYSEGFENKIFTRPNIQFFFRREQEEFRSRREQRTFWGSGKAFRNSKTTNIFFN